MHAQAVEVGREAGRAADLCDLESPRAVALMGGRGGTMPEREWKRSFLTGMTPDDAKLAKTYRRNTVAADPKRRRR